MVLPYKFLIPSAYSNDVCNPSAISFVIYHPPKFIVFAYTIVFSKKIAIDVVPHPISIQTEPKSNSWSLKHANPEA